MDKKKLFHPLHCCLIPRNNYEQASPSTHFKEYSLLGCQIFNRIQIKPTPSTSAECWRQFMVPAWHSSFRAFHCFSYHLPYPAASAIYQSTQAGKKYTTLKYDKQNFFPVRFNESSSASNFSKWFDKRSNQQRQRISDFIFFSENRLHPPTSSGQLSHFYNLTDDIDVAFYHPIYLQLCLLV